MSVYQVEQFYIHLDISKLKTVGRLKVVKYLEDNDYSEFEVQGDGFIVIDGFEDSTDAENIEFGIIEILNNN